MPFEQAFYQSTRTGACAFLSLPVDRPVFAQQIGQFPIRRIFNESTLSLNK